MPKYRVPVLLLVVGLALGLLIQILSAGFDTEAALSPWPDSASQVATVRQTLSDQDGLKFTLYTPQPEILETEGLMVRGLNRQIQQSGAPALPYYGTLIAIPPGATITVRIREYESRDIALAEGVRPVPGPSTMGDSEVSERPSNYQPTSSLNDVQVAPPPLISHPDRAIYERDDLYPSRSYTVSAPVYYRDLRLINLSLFPLRTNPKTRTLRHVARMEVSVSFVVGAIRPPDLSGATVAADQSTIAALVLNYEQAMNYNWRQFPADLRNAPASSLPVGVPLYRIELDQEGIYEISGDALAQAGMPISQVDPATLEMMYRGQPVAYRFLGDGDSVLESGEYIRFYGWPFDGARTEKQFINENVFWIWSGGDASRISSRASESGNGYLQTVEFGSIITREPENHFFAGWTRWENFPNEPDAWYWDYITKLGQPPITRTYEITLPDPVAAGPDADFLVEVSSRENLFSQPHLVETRLNNNSLYGMASWYGRANVNITQTLPISRLVDGINQVQLIVASNSPVESLYLNRVTVGYRRELQAVDDQLFFDYTLEQPREFHIGRFSEPNAAEAILWDVSQPTAPVEIVLDQGDIIGSGSYTYTFGSSALGQESRFVVTTAAKALAVTKISQYVAPNLNPADGRASWLAITHGDFITPANILAAHRSTAPYGNMDTLVVDVADIVNQYGYGLALPQAIGDYLAQALSSWELAPSYVLLLGDATQNPRNLDCLQGCAGWDKDEPTYLLTDLVFEDRFQGLIPSDHSFVLLSGDDLLPDMAIGRISASSVGEAMAAVNKIMLYEQNLLAPANYQRRMLFVADNADGGGDFCYENLVTGGSIPSSFGQTHLCLEPAGPISGSQTSVPLTFSDTLSLRASMSALVNQSGVLMMNYRGHGSIENWASEGILTSSQLDFWDNSDQPLVLLSADCLDGHFAWPSRPGLGETFLKLNNGGSAAHWSSSGLGYTYEHTVLHTAFLEGIFTLGLTRVGDAVNYAKMLYDQGGYDRSELYSFILQGDPAMLLIRQNSFLPVITSP